MMMAVQAQQYPENLGFTLCGSQEWMDTYGGFSDLYLNPLQQDQMQLLQNINMLRNQNLGFPSTLQASASCSYSSESNPLSMESLAAQMDKHTLEIDQFLLFQNERLRLALQEHWKHQLATLVRAMESKAKSLLIQKDEYIARAAKRRMELEEYLYKIEMVCQKWQSIAKEKEAMVMTLKNAFEQSKENACGFTSAPAEDAVSCCDISQGHFREEKISKDGEEEEEEPMRKIACKICNSRRSSILFLPCRHLCLCNFCAPFLDSCPVCNSPKKASVEVLLS